MVKSITVNFDDEDFELLVSVKKNASWRDFIMTLVQSKNEQDKI